MEVDFSNEEALTSAFKQIQIHLDKVEELGIKPDMSDEEEDALVLQLAEDKALAEGETDWKKYTKGQRFYVKSLVKDLNMDEDELLEYHYKKAFAEVATQTEMQTVIKGRLADIRSRLAAKAA